MTKKSKKLLNYILTNGIFFFLSIFTLQVNSETKIIAKDGDTLFNLSKEYGVSLKELMHKNNINNANLILEGKTILIPVNNFNKNDRITYKVIEGDTLYKIARDYNVNIKDIISINKIDNELLLKPNQIIILPNGATYKKLISLKG